MFHPKSIQSTTPNPVIYKIHCNIILQSIPMYSKWSPDLRSTHQNPTCTSPLSNIRHMPHTFHSCSITVICGVEYRSWSSSLCNFLHSSVTSFLLGLNIFLSTLFPNILGLCSSFSLKEKVSNPYKTTVKIILPYTVIPRLTSDPANEFFG